VSLLVAVSVNRVPIRLALRRWARLAGYYDEILGAVARPDYVMAGAQGELVAIRELRGGGCLQVTYREVSRGNGYVVRSSFAARPREIGRIIWRRASW
jgi:hypothetical protein